MARKNQVELSTGQEKTAKDNQWVSVVNVEENEDELQEKTAKDNQWISTNKNSK